MRNRVAGLVWCALFVNALIASAPCRAAIGRKPDASSRLVALAAAQFPNLTKAERTLLEFADIKNRAAGDFAVAGPSGVPNDSMNDPVQADKWDHQREVRAESIRWLCVDPEASRMVDPRGIRLLGARVTGKLDLSHVKVPFSIAMIRCSIPERMNFDSAEIPKLDLHASSTGEIFAPSINVLGDADIGWDSHDYGGPFRASGEVDLNNSHIGGSLTFGTGKFHSSAAALEYGSLRAAVDISGATVNGSVAMCCSFEAQGMVVLQTTTVGQGLQCMAGHFNNPGGVALNALAARIGGDVFLSELDWERYGGQFEADGSVDFTSAHVGGFFYVHQARFKGATGAMHGLNASEIEVAGSMLWQGVELENGAALVLGGAKVNGFLDDEQSWPKPGNLFLDGFVYTALGPPVDAASRLRWLALQPPGFRPQPYRQLAKFLADNGDETGATQVLIAKDDARYSMFGTLGAVTGGFLKTTIGYGHRPLLAIVWMLLVVTIGWVMVFVGKRAGVMRPTWPENVPNSSSSQPDYEDLHPFLYSLDVFLPFVNLHQEHYWWPKTNASGEYHVMGRALHGLEDRCCATTSGHRSSRDGCSARSSSQVLQG